MRSRWRLTLVILLYGACFAISVGKLHLGVLHPVFALTYLSLGGFLVLRRPSEPFAWYMFGFGVVTAVSTLVPEEWFWPISGTWLYGGGTALLLLYPDGRLPSRKWRPLVWAAAAAWIVSAFDVRLLLPAIVIALLMATAPVWRFRTAPAATRAQLKWLAWVVGVGVLGLVAVQASALFVGWEAMATRAAIWLPALAGVFGVPVAMVASVLRYRLYDIDRIVTRTVSYAVVAGLLAAVYAAMVIGMSQLVGQGSSLVVAASTLAVAAMFNSLRRRVQATIDRRFNRAHYDAKTVMDEFATSLKDRIDLDGMVQAWVGVVAKTMEPTTVSAWVEADE